MHGHTGMPHSLAHTAHIITCEYLSHSVYTCPRNKLIRHVHMYTINTQLSHTLLKEAQLIGFKFQALLKSSTLLNEEQINLGSMESWSGSHHSSEVPSWPTVEAKRFTQTDNLVYVITSYSLNFVFWLGRIITHYEYAFTSQQETTSVILIEMGSKEGQGRMTV